jgi:uncharacterized membrane protein
MGLSNFYTHKENPSLFHPMIVSFQRHSWILLCIILSPSILLRLPNLNQSLWFDELGSTHLMLYNIDSLINLVLHNPSPPFHYIFMFLWIRLFGDSELSVRTPPLLFLDFFHTLNLHFSFKIYRKERRVFNVFFIMCVSSTHLVFTGG